MQVRVTFLVFILVGICFADRSESVENSYAEGSGLENGFKSYLLQAVYTIHIMDVNDFPLNTGGSAVTAIVTPPSGTPLGVAITDNNDGTYTAKYDKIEIGEYVIENYLNNQLIGNVVQIYVASELVASMVSSYCYRQNEIEFDNTKHIELPYSFNNLGGINWEVGNVDGFGFGVSSLTPPDGRNRIHSLFSGAGSENIIRYPIMIEKIGSRVQTDEIELYFFPDLPMVRYVYTFSLDREAQPINDYTFMWSTIESVPNFTPVDGSDDAAFTRWFISSQVDQFGGVSYILYYVAQLSSSITFNYRLFNEDSFSGVIVESESITVNPGETVSNMVFATYSSDLSYLLAIKDELDQVNINPKYLVGLSNSRIDSLQNFELDLAADNVPIPYSHSNLCQISSEVRDRISETRGNKKHFFSEPWFC